MTKRLYLASAYGFSKQVSHLLSEFKEIFKDLNIEVFEPFERSKPIINTHKKWAYEVANANLEGIKKSDCIFAIVNGNPPDEGVMVEIGIATALKKQIFLFRDDFRRCSDSEEYPLNLMIFLGLPKLDWEKYYFQSIEEIFDPKKNFIKWCSKN